MTQLWKIESKSPYSAAASSAAPIEKKFVSFRCHPTQHLSPLSMGRLLSPFYSYFITVDWSELTSSNSCFGEFGLID